MKIIKKLLRKIGTAIAVRKGVQIGSIDPESGKVIW